MGLEIPGHDPAKGASLDKGLERGDVDGPGNPGLGQAPIKRGP